MILTYLKLDKQQKKMKRHIKNNIQDLDINYFKLKIKNLFNL